METPHISVVVPTYDGEKTLTACLASLLQQTYTDFELVVVDNNSSDGTKAIIESFAAKDKRVRYVFEKKQSRGAARNACIENATGAIIAMTDDDCTVAPDWLARLIEPVRNGSTAAVMGTQLPSADAFISNAIQKLDAVTGDAAIQNGHAAFLDTKNFAASAKLLRDLLFDERFKAYEDYELYFRLRQFTPIQFLPEVKVVHHHPHTLGAVAKTYYERGFYMAKIYQKFKGVVDKNNVLVFPSMGLLEFCKAFSAVSAKDLAAQNVSTAILWIYIAMFWNIGLISGYFTKSLDTLQ